MTTSTLGAVAEFVNGAAFTPADWADSGAPIIRIQNLTDPAKPFNRTRRAVADKLVVRPGDILVSWSATLGVFLWDQPENGLLNQHIFRVIPDESVVDAAYLRRVLTGALDDMKSHLHGATMQHVNRGAFLSTKILLPALPEQRRIAKILDCADRLRAQRRRAISLLDELAKSQLARFISTSSDPRKITLLGDVADVRTGPFGSLLHREDYVSGGIPLVNPMHISNGRVSVNPEYSISAKKFAELENFALRVDDIVLGRRGEMGRAAVIHAGDGPLICGTGSMILRPKPGKVLGDVLVQLLSSAAVRSSLELRAQGVTMLNLNQTIVAETPLNIPPYEDQSAFVDATRALASMRATHQRHLSLMDELFISLQQRAFAGGL